MPTQAFMVAGFYISTKRADAEFDSDAWLSARPNQRVIPEAIRVDPSTISFYFLLDALANSTCAWAGFTGTRWVRAIGRIRLQPVDDDSSQIENRRENDCAKRRRKKIQLGDDSITQQR
jgi:hypothetical protein